MLVNKLLLEPKPKVPAPVLAAAVAYAMARPKAVRSAPGFEAAAAALENL